MTLSFKNMSSQGRVSSICTMKARFRGSSKMGKFMGMGNLLRKMAISMKELLSQALWKGKELLPIMRGS